MNTSLTHRGLAAFEALSPADTSALLESAHTLQRAADAGRTQPLLRGKNFALLCEADDSEDAAAFRRAAVELGAHVAYVRPSLSELSTREEVQHTARLLGRLYDALECQGMSATVVQQMSDVAGVPVYDDVAGSEHPTARLADMLGGDASAPDKRRFVLQAVLLSTLG